MENREFYFVITGAGGAFAPPAPYWNYLYALIRVWLIGTPDGRGNSSGKSEDETA